MPFYEYQCRHCDHRLEVLQKISDDPLVYCPQCNEATLRKLVSAAAFRLKGTGWYETDFKGNGKGQEKSADGDGKSADSGKDTPADKAGEKGDVLPDKAAGKKSGGADAAGAKSSGAGATA